ncbi:hypothetical protein [Roseomonas sp. BN140053]|uniref:hypothetical protein n=1 Tax=Roseomonas sp. BN140053 TaxID=3391898 RepID=UPI0039E95029
MSDNPAPATTPAAEAGPGSAPAPAGLPRGPAPRRLDPAVLPILAGVVVLGGALFFLFAWPSSSVRPAENLRTRIESLDERLASLERLPQQVRALETRPDPAAGLPERLTGNERRLATLESTAQELAARPPGDPSNKTAIEALTARVAAIETGSAEAVRRLEEHVAGVEAAATQRVAALESRAGDADRQIEARVAAMEARATEAGRQIESRLAAAESRAGEAERRSEARAAETDRTLSQRLGEAQRQLAERLAAAEQAITPRLQALDQSIAQRVEAASGELDRRIGAQNAALDQRLAVFDARVRQAENAERRVGLLAARGALQSALEAGRPLGAALSGLPGTPAPALARFATAAPPTEAALRLSFEDAAREARAVAQPRGQGVVDSALARIQGLVTVRRGEQVLVGDAVSGELEQARNLLDAGDLGGAVARLDQLPPEPKAAMAAWLGQARGLLDARNAVRDLTVAQAEGTPAAPAQPASTPAAGGQPGPAAGAAAPAAPSPAQPEGAR